MTSIPVIPAKAGIQLSLYDDMKVKSFHCPFGPASYFSLLVQRNSSQKKGHPAFAPASRVREPEPGFSTAHPVLTKTRVRPARAPSGLIVSVSPLPRGWKTSLLAWLGYFCRDSSVAAFG